MAECKEILPWSLHPDQLRFLLASAACHLIAQSKQFLYFRIRYWAIQEYRNPVFFVHVVCWIKPRLHTKRTNDSRIAFQIQNIDLAITRNTQLRLIYLNHNSIPFVIICMAQYRIPVIPWVIRFSAILLSAPFKNIFPVHPMLLTTSISDIASIAGSFHWGKERNFDRCTLDIDWKKEQLYISNRTAQNRVIRQVITGNRQ